MASSSRAWDRNLEVRNMCCFCDYGAVVGSYGVIQFVFSGMVDWRDFLARCDACLLLYGIW